MQLGKGNKVKHARFGEGKVIYIKEETIKVVFGELQIKKFPYPQSIQDGTLSYINSSINSHKIHIHESRNVFFCFQGKQYQHESVGGYIFALPNKGIPSWERLRNVKKGDVIFHCDTQKIKAISIAEGEYSIDWRPQEHYLANDKKDEKGLIVKTKYLLLERLKASIITSQYTEEIKRLQGDHEGKGYPFDKNGEGNQGYLFNLNRELANFFLQKILQCNSIIAKELQEIQQKEKIEETFIVCPECNLNWTDVKKGCCDVCKKKTQNKTTSASSISNKNKSAYFQEEFTFTSQRAFYRGKSGFQAYNSKKENVGLVFMCDDKRTPAYEHCELCMYPAYYNQYGEWHRITSHGGRIKWSKLCEILKSRTEYKVFID